MSDLPKDERGYPIAHFVGTNPKTGKPDFTIINTHNCLQAAKQRLCALCGKKLFGMILFVGGRKSMQSQMFTDGPMHLDCAEYALKVCPFLAAPKFGYSRKDPADPLHVIDTVSTDRPEVFFAGRTADYKWQIAGGALYYKAAPWSQVQAWKNGVPTTQSAWTL